VKIGQVTFAPQLLEDALHPLAEAFEHPSPPLRPRPAAQAEE